MDRRSALRNMALLGGGMFLAPSCTFSEERVSIALNNLNISGKQERQLAEMVEIIIPATEDSPGAKDLKIHHFVLVMVDDCRSRQDQKDFVTGLDQVDQLARNQHGADFAECSASQRESMVTEIHEGNGEGKSKLEGDYQQARPCLSMTRQYTILGFLNSEYVMTEELPYQLVPGHFDGCVDL